MKASDFASFITGNAAQFSLLDQNGIVAKLRELADRIERNERPKLALQNAFSCEKATVKDYLITTLVLEFGEIHPSAPVGTKLWGTAGFPIDHKPREAGESAV